MALSIETRQAIHTPVSPAPDTASPELPRISWQREILELFQRTGGIIEANTVRATITQIKYPVMDSPVPKSVPGWNVDLRTEDGHFDLEFMTPENLTSIVTEGDIEKIPGFPEGFKSDIGNAVHETGVLEIEKLPQYLRRTEFGEAILREATFEFVQYLKSLVPQEASA